MTDNMKKFLEAASKDEALKAEVNALAEKFDRKSADENALKAAAIELAAKHGFTLTDDDFKPSEMTELTEDEMKAVAGGTGCGCAIFGGGGDGEGGVDCFCAAGGAGLEDKDKVCCACPAVGVGAA